MQESSKSPSVPRAPRPAPPPPTPEQLAHIDETLLEVVQRAGRESPSLEPALERVLQRALSTRSEHADALQLDALALSPSPSDANGAREMSPTPTRKAPADEHEEKSRKHKKSAGHAASSLQLAQKPKRVRQKSSGRPRKETKESPRKNHASALEELLNRMPETLVPTVRELERLRAQQRQLDKFNTNLAIQDSTSASGNSASASVSERARPEAKPIAYCETRGLPSGRDLDRAMGDCFVELNKVLRFLPINKARAHIRVQYSFRD